MAAGVVTVRTFGSELEAVLLRGKLAQHGLHPTVSQHSRYKAMAGAGFWVNVPRSEAARAREIIAELERPLDLDEYVDAEDERHVRCPMCRSVNVRARALSRGEQWRVMLSLGAWLLFVQRDRHCGKCGHAWRE